MQNITKKILHAAKLRIDDLHSSANIISIDNKQRHHNIIRDTNFPQLHQRASIKRSILPIRLKIISDDSCAIDPQRRQQQHSCKPSTILPCGTVIKQRLIAFSELQEARKLSLIEHRKLPIEPHHKGVHLCGRRALEHWHDGSGREIASQNRISLPGKPLPKRRLVGRLLAGSAKVHYSVQMHSLQPREIRASTQRRIATAIKPMRRNDLAVSGNKPSKIAQILNMLHRNRMIVI